jgi:4-hydroxy-tetrahydrodipicolinate reductase
MKIAILGYGKMGKEIEDISLYRSHTVPVKIDEYNSSSVNPQLLKNVDVAIEFSTPESAIPNIRLCLEAGIPVVVGTTGWYKDFPQVKKEVEEKKGTLFCATNFSVGVNLFFRLNEYLAAMMNKHSDYEVIMEEIHHMHKKDAPSGTAITLAEGILKHMTRKKNWVEPPDNNPEHISIHSIREGEAPGTHTVVYSSQVDEITISHVAHNRKGFANGAVIAAEWIVGKKGIFTMKDMLGF